ncbi:Protein of unknown function [Flavobacteriaceae bacterium MAR_2010_188]|nr:Protein of unknown function [Flavobacteriaceae bacterium MAR_2010_188]
MKVESPIREIEISLLKFADDRGDNKTFCPSETAREVFNEDWSEKMDLVREVSDELVLNNKLIVLQKGEIMDALPSKLKGPIRLRRKPPEL